MNIFTSASLNHLTTDSDLLRRFEEIKSNQERLETLRHLLEKEPGFLDSLQKISGAQMKDLHRSLEAKDMGVRYFGSRRCHAALLKTNESLSLAPPDCDFLPQLFGNRSAILFDLGNYEDSLVSIELAFMHSMPDLLKVKLLFRKSKCLKLLGRAEAVTAFEHCREMCTLLACHHNEDTSGINRYEDLKIKFQESWKDLETTSTSSEVEGLAKADENSNFSVITKKELNTNLILTSKNDDFPVACRQISLSASAQFGRGVFAVEDVSPGQIVVIEEAAVSVLCPRDQFRLSHCHYCLNRNPARLVPCDHCDVLFCDDHCKKLCESSTHAGECRVLAAIKCIPTFGVVEMLALRFVLHETKQGTDIDDLCSKITVAKSQEAQFESLAYQLETNETGRDLADMVARVFKSFVICQLLRANNFFRDDDNDMTTPFVAKVRQFGSLLVHYFQVVACNAHDINTFFSSQGPDGDQIQIGSGLYPFCSMFNHSCDPNVVRHSRGSSVMVSALRAIAKGEQLFDNYGCHYATMEKSQRQTYLWEQYRFQCACQACVDDYPLYQVDREEAVTFVKHVTVDNDRRGEVQVSIRQSMESFNNVLSEIVANGHRAKDLEGKLSTVRRHMELLNRYVLRPHQEFEKCQETYKRILCYLTNCAILQDGETIPE